MHDLHFSSARITAELKPALTILNDYTEIIHVLASDNLNIAIC